MADDVREKWEAGFRLEIDSISLVNLRSLMYSRLNWCLYLKSIKFDPSYHLKCWTLNHVIGFFSIFFPWNFHKIIGNLDAFCGRKPRGKVEQIIRGIQKRKRTWKNLQVPGSTELTECCQRDYYKILKLYLLNKY